jgi:hypothetical protein
MLNTSPALLKVWRHYHQPLQVHKLKLAKARVSALVHGGAEQKLESLLDFGRLGVEELDQAWRSGGRIAWHVFFIVGGI